MTVNSTDNRTRLAANGVLTEFDFDFPIIAAADLKVYTIDADGVATLKTNPTHYSVTISDEVEGGTVTFLVAPTNGHDVLMLRDADYGQPTDIPNAGGFREARIEAALDRLAMQILQLKDITDRSLVLGETSEFSNITIPDPEENKLLGWNGDDELVNFAMTALDFDVVLGAGDAGKVVHVKSTEDGYEVKWIKVMKDADADTMIQVEEAADEDKIRFDTGGTQRMLLDSNGLILQNGVAVNEFSSDGTMAGNSNAAVPTEAAVVTYVEANTLTWEDRGDPATVDFDTGDFTKDGNWHTVDLSSIVPAGAKLVLLRTAVATSTLSASRVFDFRKNGNTNDKNAAQGYTQVTSATIADKNDHWVTPDANRVIEYRLNSGAYEIADLTVGGWFK